MDGWGRPFAFLGFSCFSSWF